MTRVATDFLAEMRAAGSDRADEAVRREAEYRAIAAELPPATRLAESGGFRIIAEAKLASPAEGRLADDGDDVSRVVDLARAYESGGASCISVLTVPERFDGSLAQLDAVAGAVGVPVLRKDFLVSPAQVVEARAHGASGALLIARMLDGGRLAEMIDIVTEMGMFALVELFDEADLALAEPAFERDVLVGVNARNLTDLSVDQGRLTSMGPRLPGHLVRVAESGIRGPEDVARLVEAGYDMALVGTSLVRSGDPATAVRELVTAGTDAMSGATS